MPNLPAEDEVLSAVLEDEDLRIVLARGTEVARAAQALQKSENCSASLLGQALTAAALMSAFRLGKGSPRINLQLECDGPLRGLFADADGSGAVRGFAKNPFLAFEGGPGEFRWRPALGNSGYLSVLIDQDEGQVYRSSIELEKMDLALDLERYFQASEQLETAVFTEVISTPENALGAVFGLFLQPFPSADRSALHRHRALLRDGRKFAETVAAGPERGARDLLAALFPESKLQFTSRVPLVFRCTCSRERVLGVLASTGKAELEDMLAKDGKAEVVCHFCSRTYDVSALELKGLISQIAQPS